MKNLVAFECKGPQLAELVERMHIFFASKSSNRLIITVSNGELVKRRVGTLGSVNFDRLLQKYADQPDVEIKIELKSDVYADMMHRLPVVNWSVQHKFQEALRERAKSQPLLKSQITVAGKQLKASILFAEERMSQGQKCDQNVSFRPSYHFQTIFKYAIPPIYMPLVIAECSTHICAVGKWSATSCTYLLKTTNSCLLEVNSYGVSDATLFGYDLEYGFIAPYQEMECDVPDPVRHWNSRLQAHKKLLALHE